MQQFKDLASESARKACRNTSLIFSGVGQWRPITVAGKCTPNL